jgi:hypothetical protein
MRALGGLSVFVGRESRDGIAVQIPETTAPAKRFRLAEKLIGCMLQRRSAFTAIGTKVATGPDGEPLLDQFTLTPLGADVPLYPPEWMQEEVPGVESFFSEWQRWREECGPSPVHREIRDAPRDLRDRGRRVLAACRLLIKEQEITSGAIDREIRRGTRPIVGRMNPWRW